MRQKLHIGCLLWISVALLGCEAESPSPPPVPESVSTPLTFTDVTEVAGLSEFRHLTGAQGDKWFPEAMGSGCAFLDYDGDGHLDILLVGGGEWEDAADGAGPALYLYRNNQDGTFTSVTQEAGLSDLRAYGFGVAAADYDNDGDQDVMFTALGPNYLLRNDDGRFTDVAAAAGVQGGDEWSTSPVFFDADRDGHLDLYIGNYVDWSPERDIVCTLDGQTKSYCTPELYKGIPSRFYHNNGDGTFTDRTEEAGFTDGTGKMLGGVELDYNNDGRPDLAVASDTQPDLLYRNDGDPGSRPGQVPTFTEIGALSGIAYDENGRARAGMGIDAGVIDDTGKETVFVGNFSKEMIAVFRYLDNDLFLDRAAASKIGRPSLMTLTFGLFLFDGDLDGDLDLFAANGHVQEEIERTQDGITYRQPPHLFLNEGNGTFTDVASEIGGVMTEPLVARGAVYGDYDRDGDLDVLVTENGGGAHLWRNDLATDAASLRVRLEGTRSNRDGIGARLVVVAGEHRMQRRVRTGTSFLSQPELTATFGLGTADRVDSLIVYWPSGQVDRLADLPVNDEIRITEE